MKRKIKRKGRKIEKSNYNGLYRKIKTDEVFLSERREKKERCIIVRFSCGNEMKGTNTEDRRKIRS